MVWDATFTDASDLNALLFLVILYWISPVKILVRPIRRQKRRKSCLR